MKAIILAAGRGERMRPLTDHTPKPLLAAGGRTLIEWQILRLAQCGVRELVVNVSHLAEQVERALGAGARYGVRISYSHEPFALETAGGIAQALPLLGAAPFIAINADVYCDYDYHRAVAAAQRIPSTGEDAHLVLVDNPQHHPDGDFGLSGDRVVPAGAGTRLTFSGIGVYRPTLFAGIPAGTRRALGPLLHERVAAGTVSGERHGGTWMDIGTPERLARLDAMLRAGR